MYRVLLRLAAPPIPGQLGNKVLLLLEGQIGWLCDFESGIDGTVYTRVGDYPVSSTSPPSTTYRRTKCRRGNQSGIDRSPVRVPRHKVATAS